MCGLCGQCLAVAQADGIKTFVADADTRGVHGDGHGVGVVGASSCAVGQKGIVLANFIGGDVSKGEGAVGTEVVGTAHFHPNILEAFGCGDGDGLPGAGGDVQCAVFIVDLGADGLGGQRAHVDVQHGVFYHAAVGRETVVRDGFGEVDTDGVCIAGSPCEVGGIVIVGSGNAVFRPIVVGHAGVGRGGEGGT